MRSAPSTRHPGPIFAAAAGATLALAAASTLGVAASSGAFNTASQRCAAPALPGTVVQITAWDMPMQGSMMIGRHTMRLVASTPQVQRGTVSLILRNAGNRTHALVVLPRPAHQPAGARPVTAGRVAKTGSLGEASRTCGTGAGDGITAGATGWVSLQMSARRYELICNQKTHYTDGMFTELDVP